MVLSKSLQPSCNSEVDKCAGKYIHLQESRLIQFGRDSKRVNHSNPHLERAWLDKKVRGQHGQGTYGKGKRNIMPRIHR
jgi:hypothetical protein